MHIVRPEATAATTRIQKGWTKIKGWGIPGCGSSRESVNTRHMSKCLFLGEKEFS